MQFLKTVIDDPDEDFPPDTNIWTHMIVWRARLSHTAFLAAGGRRDPEEVAQQVTVYCSAELHDVVTAAGELMSRSAAWATVYERTGREPNGTYGRPVLRVMADGTVLDLDRDGKVLGVQAA